jgi:hypothetical protein
MRPAGYLGDNRHVYACYLLSVASSVFLKSILSAIKMDVKQDNKISLFSERNDYSAYDLLQEEP